MKRILTALQPSGLLHIGNYVGAIVPAIELQKDHHLLLFSVDYHAITVPQDPKELRKNILFAAAVYLAAGLNPTKSLMFQQSAVPFHTELAWILSCSATMGELSRMTQFKDKSTGKGETVSVGLYTYPILMAADILLYDTEHVPVGDDQKQHLELTRDLALRFNKRFGETFVVPEPMIPRVGARIMSLDDPTKKMSKSSPSPKSYISLMDSDENINKKIKSAVTDSRGTITFEPEERPAIANLLTIYAVATGRTQEDLANEHANSTYASFKASLSDAVIAWMSPLRKQIEHYLADETALIGILDEGAERAKHLAEEKMRLVRQRIGVDLRTHL